MQSTITRRECLLVQASFAQIEPIASSVAARFYARLFQLDPQLVALFKSDLNQQGIKLMEKLAVAVMGLEDLGTIAPLVSSLGQRHASYGVRSTDYDTALEALLFALEEALGPAFDDELRNAWKAAFSVLSREMQRAGSPKG